MAEQQQISGEGFTSYIAGMTKTELYNIMSQMKDVTDQNRQQAKQILVENPLLTRALFQAQIMLGMVRPPEVMPNIQENLPNQQSTQVRQLNAQPVPVQGGLQGQAISSQSSISARQQHPTQPSLSLPTVSAPLLTLQSQPLPSNPPHSVQQTTGFFNAPNVPVAPPPSQIHNMHLPPPQASSHYSIIQPHMPMVSGQMQQSLQPPGLLHQPLQPPPLPQQPRPPSMQPFAHQPHSQMPPGHGFQGSSAPQPPVSQTFHPASNPPGLFSTTFPSQQQLYQGGPHPGPDYGSHAGTSMHPDRGASRGPGLPEKPQLPGLPPPMGPGQMAPSSGGPPPRPPPLNSEMEQVLLHQVMNLTPEQINLLPPEQRQQVIQLQEMMLAAKM